MPGFGDSYPASQIPLNNAAAVATVNARLGEGGDLVTEGMINLSQGIESGHGDKNGLVTIPGVKQANPTTTVGGLYQLSGGAIQDAAALLGTQPPLDPNASDFNDRVNAIRADPKQAAIYATAYMATQFKSIPPSITDPGTRQRLALVGYNLGTGKMTALIQQATAPTGKFDPVLFGQLFDATTEGKASQYWEKAGGPTGASIGSSAVPKAIVPTMTPADVAAYSPLSFDVSQLTPAAPKQILTDGLDTPDWPETPGLFRGREALNFPAYFQVRTARSGGDTLTNPVTKQPINVRLNVSLQRVDDGGSHIATRQTTHNGFLITLWGQNMNTLVGRGTTGAFLNAFGLVDMMSTQDLPPSFVERLKATAWAQNPAQLDALFKNQNPLRVAAQDAFYDLLALFKNNGVIRFVGNQDTDVFGGDQANDADSSTVYTPSAGATGYQMNARRGAVLTRGSIIFRLRGSTYKGYFKSLNFTASADNPFKWDFDFNFRVLESLNPVYTSLASGKQQ